MPQAGQPAAEERAALRAGHRLQVERAVGQHHRRPARGPWRSRTRSSAPSRGCRRAATSGCSTPSRRARRRRRRATPWRGRRGCRRSSCATCRLIVAVADDQHVAERNDGEGDQGREHREARRQRVQQPVGAGGHDVLLGEELERVGHQRVDQAEAGEAEDGGPVGADAILDERAALALEEHAREPITCSDEQLMTTASMQCRWWRRS